MLLCEAKMLDLLFRKNYEPKSFRYFICDFDREQVLSVIIGLEIYVAFSSMQNRLLNFIGAG